jgi:hypothetical protein
MFSLHDLLLHTPLQIWPLLRHNVYPCSFCDLNGDPHKIENHVADQHPIPHQINAFFSPLQMQLAGLLSVRLQIENASRWKWRFGCCRTEFRTFTGISDHVNEDDQADEKFLYDRLGGFWAGIFCHLNRTGIQPSVNEMMFGDQERSGVRKTAGQTDRWWWMRKF